MYSIKQNILFVLSIIFGIIFLQCHSQKENKISKEFKIPIIINSRFNKSLTSTPFESKNIEGVFPHFIGKYTFQDTIDINSKKRKTAYQKDFITEKDLIEIGNSINFSGLEWIIDYNTTVRYNPSHRFNSKVYEYYPVFFVNQTNQNKLIEGKDGYLFAIQEALLKETGEWHPIESKGADFCGNGYWGLIIHPGEFALGLLKKYKGNYKTKLRIRLKMGSDIFISSAYDGIINKEQFSIKDTFTKNIMQETNGKIAQSLFYGGMPPKSEWQKDKD